MLVVDQYSRARSSRSVHTQPQRKDPQLSTATLLAGSWKTRTQANLSGR